MKKIILFFVLLFTISLSAQVIEWIPGNSGSIAAEETEEDTIWTYISDWSADVDGWQTYGTGTTITPNVDGVSDGTTSFDNCLKITNSSFNGYLGTLTNFMGCEAGSEFIVRYIYYIPDTNAIGSINFAGADAGYTLISGSRSADSTYTWDTASFRIVWNDDYDKEIVVNVDAATNPCEWYLGDVRWLRIADSLPTQFAFTQVTGAELNTYYTSNTVNLVDFDSALATVTNGQMSINIGTPTSTPTKVYDGDNIALRGLSANNYTQATNVTLTVGSISDIYTIITKSDPAQPDTIPDQFNFANLTGVPLSSYHTGKVRLEEFDSAYAYCYGDSFQVNYDGTLDVGYTKVYDGDTLYVTIVASASNGATVSTTVTVAGNITDIFSVTTVAAPPSGDVYYVDGELTTGNNDGTSWAHAWRSFADIDDGDLSPGDVVYISGGTTSKTYNETLAFGTGGLNISGSSGNPITFTKGIDANHNGEVIIDKQGSGRAIDAETSSIDYITISYLTIINTGGQAVRVDGDNWTLSHLNLPSIDNVGLQAYGADGLTIEYCYIETVTNAGGSQTDCIAIGQGTASYLIQHNEIHQNNTGSGHSDCIQSYKDQDVTRNFTIRGNWLEMNTTDGQDTQGLFLEDVCGKILIYDNLITSTGYVDHLLYMKEINTCADIGIYNNTIYEAGNSVRGQICRFLFEDGPAPVDFRNNIVWCLSSNALVINLSAGSGSTSQFESDWNLYYAPNNNNAWSGSTWNSWTNNQDDNGLNINPSLGSDFRFDSPFDPGVNTGTSNDVDDNPLPFTDDKDGITRPQGAAWDIGCYEYH